MMRRIETKRPPDVRAKCLGCAVRFKLDMLRRRISAIDTLMVFATVADGAPRVKHRHSGAFQKARSMRRWTRSGKMYGAHRSTRSV